MRPLILVCKETTPEDLRGMKAALGILTAVGGVSSHAALVSRQMGKVCIVGASELDINHSAGTLTVKDKVLHEGDDISIDGFTGEVFAGAIGTRPSEVVQVLIQKELSPEQSDTYRRFKQVMDWAEGHRKLGVRTNADLPEQAAEAIAFGAEGIGLCRTEHMFFDHIVEFRRMILAKDDAVKNEARKKQGVVSIFVSGDYFQTTEIERDLQIGGVHQKVKTTEPLITAREQALTDMLPFQRADFAGLFKAMAGRPVTIRLLDPPLHDFLPKDEAGQEEMANVLGTTRESVARRVEELHESNPMLGHRGCRLGIVYPEITAMQARAIFEAAVEVKKSAVSVHPEVMIPLVGFKKELENQEKIVREVAARVFEETGVTVEYLVGTMIEVPRACVAAGEIAQIAEFFSFGTNDLTQTTLGISRDDYGPFISVYTDPKKADIIPADPFATIDQEGVGALMKVAVEKGRASRKGLKIGICGEHGGDPASVIFCAKIGLDYVSCSPFRVPVARLAAAQAALGK